MPWPISERADINVTCPAWSILTQARNGFTAAFAGSDFAIWGTSKPTTSATPAVTADFSSVRRLT
jgi:hypothetical protein